MLSLVLGVWWSIQAAQIHATAAGNNPAKDGFYFTGYA
jgi:hypothetical protein